MTAQCTIQQYTWHLCDHLCAAQQPWSCCISMGFVSQDFIVKKIDALSKVNIKGFPPLYPPIGKKEKETERKREHHRSLWTNHSVGNSCQNTTFRPGEKMIIQLLLSNEMNSRQGKKKITKNPNQKIMKHGKKNISLHTYLCIKYLLQCLQILGYGMRQCHSILQHKENGGLHEATTW